MSLHVYVFSQIDLYSHNKTLRILFVKDAMIPTIVFKLVGVNIYENIDGQPYINSMLALIKLNLMLALVILNQMHFTNPNHGVTFKIQ